MRRILIIFPMLILLTIPVHALDLTAPTVPKYAQSWMPEEPGNLRDGMREVFRNAVMMIRPDLKEASKVCIGITVCVIILSMLRSFHGTAEKIADLIGSVAVCGMLLRSTGSLVNLAADTVCQISEYGKLLLPVLATALASQGGITTSSVLYAGTAMFDAILSGIISDALIPLIYFYLAMSVALAATGEDMLKRMRDLMKSFMVWSLKTILYIFTGFITISGVVSGPTDAAALKAARLTISGMVPVVGGILSDASEAVLVSAGTVKNAIGLYGMFAVAAICLEPFVMIGCHHLLLKLTGGICTVFSSKRITELIQDYASAMGILLGMTGAVSLMLLISTVCFMRGIG